MDDREPLGRIAWETFVDWACEQPGLTVRNPKWEAISNGEQELYARIASAVAARAVADAGTEVAAARTDRDRIRMERGAMASHLPAIRDALSAAVADARYEAQAKPYRAALEALEAAKTQDRGDDKEGPKS